MTFLTSSDFLLQIICVAYLTRSWPNNTDLLQAPSLFRKLALLFNIFPFPALQNTSITKPVSTSFNTETDS